MSVIIYCHYYVVIAIMLVWLVILEPLFIPALRNHVVRKEPFRLPQLQAQEIVLELLVRSLILAIISISIGKAHDEIS